MVPVGNIGTYQYILKGCKQKGSKVLLNKEADRTLKFSPLMTLTEHFNFLLLTAGW